MSEYLGTGRIYEFYSITGVSRGNIQLRDKATVRKQWNCIVIITVI